MCKVIAVCNQKGGVGKTTTTFNLGAALSLKNDKKVLLVDLDSQANLSEYLGATDNDKSNMTDLIFEVAQKSNIKAERVMESIRYNEQNKLYYIPSDINLANTDVVMMNAISRETILKRILSEEVKSKFDYILIDCLPSLGVLLINAMSASDGLLIPVQTQKFSMDGLETLLGLHSQITATVNPNLKLIGILPTMVDNTIVSKNALENLNTKYAENILSTVIHKSVEVAKSSESGKALCLSKNRLGEEYIALAVEVLKNE